MNSRYFKWLKSGLLGTLALLGLNACSDDHFDISPSTAKESLWTQIASNPGLDSLKQILERTTFTLDEYSPTSEVLTISCRARRPLRCGRQRTARTMHNTGSTC